MNQMNQCDRYTAYIAYLLMKVEECDWHGVADAAMDLRELEAAHPELVDNSAWKRMK